jgi:hypothetical protein
MYDAAYMRAFYDAYSEREWERFDRSPMDRVNFHVHRRFLEEYIELARLGATVHVGDLSPLQLGLNRQKVTEAGHEEAVVV